MRKFLAQVLSLLSSLAILLMVFNSSAVHAAGPTGKIVGIVSDPSGAPIPGATVTAINEGTNEARAVTSDGDGNYSIPILPVGNYSIKVVAKGFENYLQRGIVLQVDQNVTVNPQLTVGSNSETVQVTGEAGQTPDLVDATVSEVIDQQRVVDLPLNGRDTLQLQYIMPGVSYDNDNVSHGQGQHEGVVVNGNRPGSNYYLLDGVDMTDSYLSTAPVFPAPDALQEFDIQTSNFTAQYGRSSGGLVNAVTRAGTNTFHGGMFEFLRNTVLDTHNYFDVPGEAKPSLKLNQFGGYLGGPILKGKTFFFGYYQGTRQRRDESIVIGQVLTTQENPNLSSDGSAVFPAGSIYDPLTGAPFTGDMIPANRIDPTAKAAIKALMNFTPNNSTGGYTYHAPSADNEDGLNEDQYLARIDHKFSDKDQLFGHYFYNQDQSNGLGAGNLNLAHDKYFRNQNIAFEEVSQQAGAAITTPSTGRGCAFGDFNNDGCVDIVINNQNARASLLKVTSQNSNRWINIKLVGVKSNRSAIGTRLNCVAGSLSQIAEVRSGGSYLSQSDLRIHFGLGDHPAVDLLEIHWPSGTVDRLHGLSANQFVLIREGGALTTLLRPR